MSELLERKQKIRSFIVETFLFEAPDAALDDEESLLDSGIIDSTGVLELVAFVEDEFDIEVKDEELIPDNLDSISKLADFIERKQ